MLTWRMALMTLLDIAIGVALAAYPLWWFIRLVDEHKRAR